MRINLSDSGPILYPLLYTRIHSFLSFPVFCQDYMSIEWRVVIMVGSLFLLGPNLIYLYIIWYLIFIDDEDSKVSFDVLGLG